MAAKTKVKSRIRDSRGKFARTDASPSPSPSIGSQVTLLADVQIPGHTVRAGQQLTIIGQSQGAWKVEGVTKVGPRIFWVSEDGVRARRERN